MQAVIFIGIQATGKSTFFKERFFDTHVRVSLDLVKTRSRERMVLEVCLQKGQNFVVDNTNITIQDRRRYILPAKAANFEVIGYYFDSHVGKALRRNRNRPQEERIPDGGILRAYHRLQVPSFDEGFDKLYRVSIDNNDLFKVDEWKDDI